jgi:peptidoglycan/xylan/chitin deacetylase (PgdA/CDA1 family)
VVVTLDDGYADALHGASPLLEAHALSACVFVTSGLVGRVPWWDALAAAFPREGPLPERLALDVDGRPLGWDAAPPTPAAAARTARIRHVHRLLLDWPPDLRDRAIERLGRELGAAPRASELPRGLASEELRLLAGSGRVEIGAHGVSHPRLAELAEEEQRFEIEESKRALEAATGRPVRAFSYPNGSSTPRSREIVRESGFACAFGSHAGVATPGSDRFRLPRFWVGDADAACLSRLLRQWG